jgi:GTP-binding protein YchF
MDVGIVGLPASGKTAVFQALTAGHGSASGDARGEHLGAVKVPDERLEKLSSLVHAKKTTPLEVRLHDLPPLFVRGAAPSGEAAETLGRADALLHVVRAFERDDVPHPAGSVDPERDITTFDAELMLNDLAIIERRLQKLDITVRSARPGEREAGEREKALLVRCKEMLEGDRPLRDQVNDPQDLKGLSNFGLLSLKPVLLVLNVDEAKAGDLASVDASYRDRQGKPRTGCSAMCAKLEAELAELAPEDAAEFRRELGAEKGGSARLLSQLMELLGLVTFFTAGEKETRAWSLVAGGSALQAAGRIHTDIEHGFIRAEVIGWRELLEFGTHAEARKHGKLRTEGKQYVVQDGDVINVLFNV